jgi:hypothetical protein
MSEAPSAYGENGMSARIVAVSGTHGTGKTTATYTRAALPKHSHPHAQIGIICEVASRCPLPIVITSHGATTPSAPA